MTGRSSTQDSNPPQRKRASRSLFSTFFVNVAIMGAGVITGVATARAFEPSLRGVLIAVTLWTGTVSSFSLMGLDESIVYHSRGARRQATALRRALAPSLRRQGLLAGAVLIVILAFISRSQGPAIVAACLAAVIIIPLNLYVQPVMAGLRAGEVFRVWNSLRLIPTGIYSGATVLLLVLDKLSIQAALAALVLGNVLTAVACWRVNTSRHVRDTDTVDADGVRMARKYGRGVVLAMLPYVANQRIDQLFLGLFIAPSFLGIYAVAVSVCAVIQMLGTTIEQVMFPRLVAGSFDRRRVPMLVTVAILTATVAGGILAWNARALITFVYGPDYAAAANPLRLIMIGVVFLVGASVLTAEAKATGRLRNLVEAQLVGAVITVVGLPILVYLAGLNGAATTSACAYLATFCVLVIRRDKVRAVANAPQAEPRDAR